MIRSKIALLSIFIVFSIGNVRASIITEDFESFSDSDIITNEITGMTFSNTMALSSGISLNDAEYPPKSGTNVVVDDGGAIEINFNSPVYMVSAYLTYLAQVSMYAYDISNSLIGTDISDFMENYDSSGNTPNELFQISSNTGISSIVFIGDSSGYSFVLDDLSVDNEKQHSVPEPGSLALMLAALAGLVSIRRKYN